MNITIEDEGREIQDIQSEYICTLKSENKRFWNALMDIKRRIENTLPDESADLKFEVIKMGVVANEALTGGKG